MENFYGCNYDYNHDDEGVSYLDKTVDYEGHDDEDNDDDNDFDYDEDDDNNENDYDDDDDDDDNTNLMQPTRPLEVPMFAEAFNNAKFDHCNDVDDDDYDDYFCC